MSRSNLWIRPRTLAKLTSRLCRSFDRAPALALTTILDYEPRATEQVPLLIRWGRDEDALAKAVRNQSKLNKSIRTILPSRHNQFISLRDQRISNRIFFSHSRVSIYSLGQVASGDTDLVFLTLLHMKDRMPEESFFRVLSTSVSRPDFFCSVIFNFTHSSNASN